MKVSPIRYNIITRLNIPVYQLSHDIGVSKTVYILVFKNLDPHEFCYHSDDPNDPNSIEVYIHDFRMRK